MWLTRWQFQFLLLLYRYDTMWLRLFSCGARGCMWGLRWVHTRHYSGRIWPRHKAPPKLKPVFLQNLKEPHLWDSDRLSRVQRRPKALSALLLSATASCMWPASSRQCGTGVITCVIFGMGLWLVPKTEYGGPPGTCTGYDTKFGMKPGAA